MILSAQDARGPEDHERSQRGGSGVALIAENRIHLPTAERSTATIDLRGNGSQHATGFEPRDHLVGALGIDRLAERVAANVLARDLTQSGAAQPARDAAGGAVAIAASAALKDALRVRMEIVGPQGVRLVEPRYRDSLLQHLVL